jgi:hypothetical protein
MTASHHWSKGTPIQRDLVREYNVWDARKQ